MLGEGRSHRFWQHRRPAAATFALTDHDLTAFEIHVLHPQPQHLQQPQAGAVQNLRHQLARPFHRANHLPDFLLRQHHRQSWRTIHPHEIARHHRRLQHLTIKEQQRIQRLILCGTRHIQRRGEVGQKRRHTGRAQITRMPPFSGGLAMKLQKAHHPFPVRPLRAQRKMAKPRHFMELILELRLGVGRQTLSLMISRLCSGGFNIHIAQTIGWTIHYVQTRVNSMRPDRPQASGRIQS